MRILRLRRARSRAFTLVELAIVVVVVGILSVIGIVAYSRQRATARTAEATNLTAGIRTAQEAFKSESGIYAAVSTNASSFYPASSPGRFVTQWGGACTNCVGGDPDGWKKLSMHASGPVMYGYATVAGVGAAGLAGAPPPPSSQPMTASALANAATVLKATDPYYLTVAWGDTDGNGTPCIVMSYSTSNQLVIQAEGE
jgi:prepilin-type N-terminal cleavage/methylation domain-containing protein